MRTSEARVSCVDRGASAMQRTQSQPRRLTIPYSIDRLLGRLASRLRVSTHAPCRPCPTPIIAAAPSIATILSLNGREYRVSFSLMQGEEMQSRAIPTAMPGFPGRQFVIRFVSSKDDGRAMAVVAWSGAYALRLPTSVSTMPLALDPHCMYLQCCPCPQLLQSLAPTVHR